jgi:hypothetical protein
MKNFIGKISRLKFLMLLLVTAGLFSFATFPGGDHYQVYIDQSLAVEQFVHLQKSIPEIHLNSNQEKLMINYSHCGKSGTDRSVSIQNDKNKILKEWTFVDVAGVKAPMTLPIKDISAFAKGKDGLKLVYKSTEIPDGRLLLTLEFGKEQKTALN